MNYKKAEYIEIKATDGSTVAFLSPESDGLKDCWIDNELNGPCTLEFEMPLNNEKWAYVNDKYNFYVGDKEFVINNPDAIDGQRDGKKLTGKVKAHESWVLLGKKYNTITNDPQRPNPPWGVVAILSGGHDLSGGRYPVGSAGHALYALLQGTGWTVGTVDVGGTYDLETEKESILSNINKVQELWGGYLVWDSINKTVSLRDETKWQNYTGFQIRYAKNLKGITRTDDYDLVTRLYPFGENDLNIANVNGGLLYLNNHSYTDKVYEGIWYDQNIRDQQELKSAGERQLAKMCRPRHNYKTDILDLRTLPDYRHEEFVLGDMVDIIDEDLGIDNRSRIINYRYNVFQPWLCELEIGDPIEKISASVAQSIVMARVVKSVMSPNTSFQNLLKGVINTVATEINGANGDYKLVDGVSTWFERDESGDLTGNLLRITPKGLVISSDGGQTWKLAISGEGIHADAGWVGKLNAGVVTIGPETTFAPGYDPTQIVAGSTVGMGVDSDCVGLWHFDGSLNSHKGVATDSNADYNTGLFGQAINIAAGKYLKVPSSGLSASQGTINFRAKSLANSPNNSILIEVPQPDNSQGIKTGIASDGRLYVQDLPSLFKYVETTQADFNTGTLTDVVATSAGDLQLATGKKLGTREKVIDLSSIGANNYGSIINFTKTDAVVTNATFTRNSEAYKSDGTKVAANVPRFEQGKFGQGVFIEEGTTNIGSPASLFDSSWVLANGTSTVIDAYTRKYTFTSTPVGAFVFKTFTLTTGVAYTWSAEIKGEGSTVGKQVRLQSAAESAYGTPVTLTTEWQRVTLTFTATDTSRALGFIGVPTNTFVSGDVVYVRFFQLEAKPYPTSFVNGTRAAETLTIPTAGVLNPTEGTISLWVKPKVVVNWNIYLNMSLSTGRFILFFSADGRVFWDFGPINDSITSPVETAKPNEWMNIVLRWDALKGSREMFINGSYIGTKPFTPPSSFPTTVSVVNNYSAVVDELAIFDYAATDEEIQAWYESNQPIPFKKGCTYKMNFDNNLQATVGTVDVEVALSTDGGDTYSQYNEVKSGLSIPGLADDTDLTNGRLKIKETLYTSDVSVTPKLHDLGFNITKKLPTTVYSSNKSGLTAWDSISLAWKPERLSLVVNDEEACYIENPGLPASLGSHVFIGTDRNGNNAINTLVDELRIDKVYREVNIRTGWHKTGVPFYTSEDMKQWPGYMKLETDGLKVYDSQDQLRVLLGSWLKDAVRKYGIKIIDGEIYSTVIQSGEEGATSYVRIGSAWEPLKVVENGKLALNIWSYGGGLLQFYDTYLDNMAGQILPMNDALGQGLKIHGRNNAGQLRDVALQGRNIRLDSQQLIDLSTNTDGWISIDAGGGFITANGSLTVYGSISKTGSLNYIEPTKDYGIRLLNAVEAPELKYVDMGRAQLQNGEAIVYLDPILLQCIEPDTELTPWLFKTEVYGEGEDIRVIEWGENYFRVKECNGGRSNRMFGWWFYATRINYAGIRLQEYVGVV